MNRMLLMAIFSMVGGVVACSHNAGPLFVAQPCWFDPGGAEDVVTCGTVAVPVQSGSSDQWDLAVVRIESISGAADLPPVVWLVDGPGGRATARMRELIDVVRPVFGVRRDLVVFDPRGVGHSEPDLSCDAFAWPSVSRLDEPVPAAEQRLLDTATIRACGVDASTRGIDLSVFTTDAMVADLERVRRALGYDRIALVATGHGTQVAQRYEVVHGEHVELIVHDSVVPDGRHPAATRPETLRQAIDEVIERCESDSRCSSRFDDVEARLAATLATLDVAPLQTPLPGSGDATAWVTADRFVAVLFALMQTRNGASQVPRLIDEVSRGQTGFVASRLAELSDQRDVDWFAHFVVACNDTPGSEFAGESDDPVLGDWLLLEVERYATVCASLGLSGPSLSRRPLDGAAPVLLLTGALDAVSPVEWSTEIESVRSRAFVEVFDALSRNTLADDCSRRIAGSFLALDGQRPTNSCADEQRFLFDAGRDLVLFDDWRVLVPTPRAWDAREGANTVRYADPDTRASVAIGYVPDSSVTAAIDVVRDDAFSTFVGARISLQQQFVAEREWTTAYYGNTESDVLYVSVTADAGDAFGVAIRGPLADVEARFHVYREMIERLGIVADAP
jgi:pimeloyl-ACP methyl ester carboxylesterase